MRRFTFFFGNSNITLVTYKKLNTMKRFENKFLFIVVIDTLILLLTLSEKNTNVNAEKFGDQREQSDVRISYATFPLGNGLWGYAQLFSQRGLCPTAFFSQFEDNIAEFIEVVHQFTSFLWLYYNTDAFHFQ